MSADGADAVRGYIHKEFPPIRSSATQFVSTTMTLEDKIFYPSPASSPVPDFKASTLIFPSISIGNVPQLTVDLLITTLIIPLVGYLPSPYLVSCAGTREDPTDAGKIGIACPLEGDSSWT
jgi:hypothetical protein